MANDYAVIEKGLMRNDANDVLRPSVEYLFGPWASISAFLAFLGEYFGQTPSESLIPNGTIIGVIQNDGTILRLEWKKPTSGEGQWVAASGQAPVTSVAGKTGAVTLNKSDVGLSNVDNTSDANKPVSTAMQQALNAISGSLVSHTGNTNNPHNVTKEQLGLGNVDNTRDADKVVRGAANDGDDNNIADTYETKTDAQTKVTTLAANVASTYQTKADAATSHGLMQADIDALEILAGQLTGLDGTNFGGIVIASAQTLAEAGITQEFANRGYSGLHWFLAGTSLASLKAYRFDGVMAQAELISNDVYDFTDFGKLQTYKGKISTTTELDALHNSTDVGTYFLQASDFMGLVSVGYSSYHGTVTQHILSNVTPDVDDPSVLNEGPTLLMRTYKNGAWTAWSNPIADHEARLAQIGQDIDGGNVEVLKSHTETEGKYIRNHDNLDILDGENYKLWTFNLEGFSGRITGGTNGNNKFCRLFKIEDANGNVIEASADSVYNESSFDVEVENAETLYMSTITGNTLEAHFYVSTEGLKSKVAAQGIAIESVQEDVEDVQEDVQELQEEISGAEIEVPITPVQTSQYIQLNGTIGDNEQYILNTYDVSDFTGSATITTNGNNMYCLLYKLVDANGNVLDIAEDSTKVIKTATIDISGAATLYTSTISGKTLTATFTQTKMSIEAVREQLNENTTQLKEVNEVLDAIRPLKGKTILMLGDSITEFKASGKGIVERLAEYTGATVIRGGIGNSHFKRRYASSPTVSDTQQAYANTDVPSAVEALVTQNWTNYDAGIDWERTQESDDNREIQTNLKAVNMSEVDIITIFAGTNDWTSPRDITIGSSSSSTDVGDIWGALMYMVRTIQTAYPRISIFFFTPIPRLYTLNNDETWSDTYVRYSGHPHLYEIAEAIRAAAKYMHTPACDLYYEMGWNLHNWRTFTNDGTHPNAIGYDALAHKMAQFIISHLNR